MAAKLATSKATFADTKRAKRQSHEGPTMKTFVCAIVCLISFTDKTFAQSQRNVSEVVKATVDAVVLIVVNDDNGKPIAEGSGFITSSDGKIVTNHHVIAGARSAIVKLNNGAFFAVDG